ncbi:MAG: hypothetical protein GQ549_05360 [Gammaproteobacteria bacterium]|nr:hypothetical protein [Gammaproteobacteria bacterium]
MIRMLHLLNLFALCVFSINMAVADVPAEQVEEVNHLLTFVKNSGCVIDRNGSVHPAEEGVSHIEMKYDYFRDDIGSTEEFIELSATRSTMSGDYYTVKCTGKETIKTQDWLLAELKRYRFKIETVSNVGANSFAQRC